MRVLILVIMAGFSVACGRDEPAGFTLQARKVERIDECHVILDAAGGKGGTFVGLRFACNVPSAALTEKNWWGDQAEPLGFAIEVGDCLNLNRTFYCLEKIEYGRSASFKAKYKMRRKGHVIEEIREGKEYLTD